MRAGPEIALRVPLHPSADDEQLQTSGTVAFAATAGALFFLTRDTAATAADMICHRVLVCVLMSLNLSTRIIDQSWPSQSKPASPPTPLALRRNLPLCPSISSSTSPPVSNSSLCIVFCLHRSFTLFYMRLCVVIPLPPSLSALYSSLYWAFLPSLLSLSLSPSLGEWEMININVSSFLPPYFPSSTFLSSLFFNNSSLFCSSHYLYLSLGLYPSSSLSLTLPSICLRLDLFLPFCLSFSGPLSAAVQYSSITVVLIIPFSACSHTVIYQINNPPLLLILCSPQHLLSYCAKWGCSACQMSLRVKVPSIQLSSLISKIAGCPYLRLFRF